MSHLISEAHPSTPSSHLYGALPPAVACSHRDKETPILSLALNSSASGHAAAGAFVSWIVRIVQRRVIVSRITQFARCNPLLQFFDLEFNIDFAFVFHSISPPFPLFKAAAGQANASRGHGHRAASSRHA